MSTPRRPDGSNGAPQWARVSDKQQAPPRAPQPQSGGQARPAVPKPSVGARPAQPKPSAGVRPAQPKPSPSGRPAQPKSNAPARPAQPKPGPSARPAQPKPSVPAQPPQRRADVGFTDAGKGAVSALTTVLERARATVVPPIEARRDERERERRKAKRRRFAIVWGRRTGYVIIAGAIVWVVLLSPVFALDPAKVEVSGFGTVVDPADVHAAVEADAGQSLATLSTGQLTSELKDIPGVRAAHVERQWPDGLVITLESREPAAAIKQAGGGYVLVDDEGVQVGRSTKVPKDLPSFTVPKDNPKVLKAALAVMAAMPDDLRERIDTLVAPTVDSVSFDLAKGPRVEWGSAEESELKVKVLKVLLTSKQARKADVIDVSAPTLPITTSNQ